MGPRLVMLRRRKALVMLRRRKASTSTIRDRGKILVKEFLRITHSGEMSGKKNFAKIRNIRFNMTQRKMEIN